MIKTLPAASREGYFIRGKKAVFPELNFLNRWSFRI
jgi:hypothetical protein